MSAVLSATTIEFRANPKYHVTLRVSSAFGVRVRGYRHIGAPISDLREIYPLSYIIYP
jgi:hypothetical protein